MTTDIDAYIAQDGRDNAIEKVAQKIAEEGVTYIYCQFISVTGRAMGKGVVASHWREVATHGFQLVLGSTANLAIDRTGEFVGYRPNASELVAIPDVETFAVLPWDRKVARVFCTLFTSREEKLGAGTFLTADSRGMLKRAHREFTADTGYTLKIGVEPEMMWLKLNADGTPSTEGRTKPNCYHIDQFAELQPVIHRVVEYGQALGLDMTSGDHEDAPGQFELNFTYDLAEATADNLTTFRQICKQVGREFDLHPCFMPKPFMGVSANGLHFNFSLWQGESNACLPEGDDVRIPSKVGLNAIGGLLRHMRGLSALTSPTVNSYRRFTDAGLWAPVYADWGFQNRTTSLRVSAPGRLEYRSADSAANPYMAILGMMAAIRHGLDDAIDPGPPEEGNIYDAPKTVDRIPTTLGEALDCLESDEVIRSAIEGDLYRVFMHLKRDEWERFIGTVSDWDIKEYMDLLP